MYLPCASFASTAHTFAAKRAQHQFSLLALDNVFQILKPEVYYVLISSSVAVHDAYCDNKIFKCSVDLSSSAF